jgi:hypothetical protein
MDLIKQGVVMARGILAQEHAPPNWALQAASLGSLLQNALKTGRLGGLGRGEGAWDSSTSAPGVGGVRAFLGPWSKKPQGSSGDG